ncbi:MAG: SPFH domain-containing protein [Myxococcaceae bacterium]|nr:SPFH domain-containing protein [Myxococcaceae bacterium]
MGIFDSIKNVASSAAAEARRNFIARADDAKDQIIYKYPERNVRAFTQLTVQADEVCLFVKDGVVVGTLGAGRHNLESNNIPFLSKLLEKVTGGDLFIAEIYFVSTREFTQIKFGGPIGDARDPETGLAIGTMVYGDFAQRVVDPEKLLVGMVGLQKTSNESFVGWFKSQVMKVIKDRIAELLVKKKWPLLDVTSGAYTEEIEEEVIAGMDKHTQNYGVKITSFGNFTISIKPEDEATLKKLSKDVAYSRLAGGFQQYAQGQAMLGAAEGMAKGGGEGGGGSGNALGGMGMGMGFGMAQMFMNQNQANQQQAAQQQQQAPAAAAGPSVMDRLKQLNELKGAGLLTDDEFNAKKAELMKLL